MVNRYSERSVRNGTLGLLALVLPVALASAQDAQPANGDGVAERQPLILPVIRIERPTGQNDLQGLYGGDQGLDLSLGLEVKPVEGLRLSADAWQVDDRQIPLANGGQPGVWQTPLPPNFLEDRSEAAFSLDQSLLTGGVESSGIDLGASYEWETEKAGTFTVSTSATYINDFRQAGNLPEVNNLLSEENQLPGSPDLQGSLTLTWQFGKHSASAVTNYFDSFKDISELNMDDINQLVENITTFDLQYGYNVLTDKQDRAVISFSFGIRNIFDRKTTQILNQNSRVIDQNGRVAYGSIKYQF